MAKIKNKTVWSDDRDYLKFLAEELDFIGRPYKLDLKAGSITQYALPPQKPKKKDKDSKKEARNKRAESAARRS